MLTTKFDVQKIVLVWLFCLARYSWTNAVLCSISTVLSIIVRRPVLRIVAWVKLVQSTSTKATVISMEPIRPVVSQQSTASYIFTNKLQDNRSQPNHHCHYRCRCHHPFLPRANIAAIARQLTLCILLLLCCTSGHCSLDTDTTLLQTLNQIRNNSGNVPVSPSSAAKTASRGTALAAARTIDNPAAFEEVVCKSIDIRNNVAQFQQLTNCTTIEGNLRIVLFDHAKEKDFENITFPKLREITDYFLLFRVMGLQSLAKLFPNLSVIRGKKLIHNYAFVVYEMLHMQEIGLPSLTTIVNGDVRIEKNPNLCFVDTIDWSRIARNYFKSGNKDQNTCPNCNESCPIVSASREDGKTIGDSYNRVCWTSDICQKHVCSPECERLTGTCSENGECCPPQCIGGCVSSRANPANQTCFACRRFIYQNRCYDNCPKNTYAFYDRRCVTAHQCLQMSRPREEIFYKPFRNKCDEHCPPGYAENPANRTQCDHCGIACPKVCPSTNVISVATAHNLKGCTVINGSLDINIHADGAEIVEELKHSLKDLKTITGFLRIAHSFPLITLDFLSNLEEIHGEMLDRESYSFLVVHNPNLQDMWTSRNASTSKRIKLLKGKLFFHRNPKLCYDKIKNMVNYMDIGDPSARLPWDERDVSEISNGDKEPCSIDKLEVKISGTHSEIVLIEFENFKNKLKDPRSLLGYLIYYREAKHTNVTFFEGRDACSNNLWNVVEYYSSDEPQPTNINSTYQYVEWHSHLIPNLKPYTQYALYIKTLTISLQNKGAQSDIIYFVTLPDTPSQPTNLFSQATKFNEIKVRWGKPSKPNGEVTHYTVWATKDEEQISHRDYCSENVKPLVFPKESLINHWRGGANVSTDSSITNTLVPNVEKESSNSSKQCCSCKNEKIRPTDVEQKILFEDLIFNTVYVKKNNTDNMTDIDFSRAKRSVDDLFHVDAITMIEAANLSAITTITTTTTTATLATTPKTEAQEWSYSTNVTELYAIISELEHFTFYTIEVRACQTHSKNENKSDCSVTAITSVRTLPLPNADDIDEQTITYVLGNRTLDTKYVPVHIKWSEPERPNGFIQSYQIEYNRVSSDPVKHVVPPYCIRLKDYYDDNGYTLKLEPGNYSVRIRARSVASFGNWTQPIFVVIEESGYSYIWISIISAVALSILLLIIVLATFVYKFKVKSAKLDYVSVNPEYINTGLGYQPDPAWEIPRTKITIIEDLGEGAFGKVYEGQFLKNKQLINCAIKTLNENALPRDRVNFLKEADIMKSFTDCNHVVKLLGICSKSQPFYVLMEIMPRGDLRNYLRYNRPDNEDNPNRQPPTLNQIYKMAIEIADGMAYLVSKKFVHRDLAARNCMLADDLTVKIGDFGMTRDVCESDYYRKGDKGMLPVRWMSPESLQDGIFTTYSDVWAYGIVLWEMVTLASQPYQGLSNEEVLKFVIEGNHMPEPENCPATLWSMMLLCWSRKPKHRPNFIKIIEMLLEHVDTSLFLPVSYYSKSKSESNASGGEPSQQDSLLAHHHRPSGGDESESESDSASDDQLGEEDVNVQFFPVSGMLRLFNDEKSPEEAAATESVVVVNGDDRGDLEGHSHHGSISSVKLDNNNSPTAENNPTTRQPKTVSLSSSSASTTSSSNGHKSDNFDLQQPAEMLPFNRFESLNSGRKEPPNPSRNVINGHIINTSIV